MMKLARTYERRTLTQLSEGVIPFKMKISKDILTKRKRRAFFRKNDVNPRVIRWTKNLFEGATNYLHPTMEARAKVCLLDYIRRRSETYHSDQLFKTCYYKKLIPLKKRLAVQVRLRNKIREAVKAKIEETIKTLSE